MPVKSLQYEQPITDLAQYLRTKGLYVRLDTPATALIGILHPGLPETEERSEATRFARTVLVERWEFADETVYLEDFTNAEMAGVRWSFHNNLPDRFGGPNLDIVQCFRDSLQELLLVIENYYFRPPVAIDNWLFPIYQQPTWQIDRIVSSVRNARMMGYIELGRMIQERLSQVPQRRTRVGDERDSAFDHLEEERKRFVDDLVTREFGL